MLKYLSLVASMTGAVVALRAPLSLFDDSKCDTECRTQCVQNGSGDDCVIKCGCETFQNAMSQLFLEQQTCVQNCDQDSSSNDDQDSLSYQGLRCKAKCSYVCNYLCDYHNLGEKCLNDCNYLHDLDPSSNDGPIPSGQSEDEDSQVQGLFNIQALQEQEEDGDAPIWGGYDESEPDYPELKLYDYSMKSDNLADVLAAYAKEEAELMNAPALSLAHLGQDEQDGSAQFYYEVKDEESDLLVSLSSRPHKISAYGVEQDEIVSFSSLSAQNFAEQEHALHQQLAKSLVGRFDPDNFGCERNADQAEPEESSDASDQSSGDVDVMKENHDDQISEDQQYRQALFLEDTQTQSDNGAAEEYSTLQKSLTVLAVLPLLAAIFIVLIKRSKKVVLSDGYQRYEEETVDIAAENKKALTKIFGEDYGFASDNFKKL